MSTRSQNVVEDAICTAKVPTDMRKRLRDFDSREQMTLTAIGLDSVQRKDLDGALDRTWKSMSRDPVQFVDGRSRALVSEVIVGAGLHAAIYAVNRVAAGFPKPLVLESSSRVGGAFAMSKGPSFYLNSRNRPGPLGTTSENAALNVIPGAILQPSHLSSLEFSTNADLAFCIRLALATCAEVRVNAKVNAVDSFGGRCRVRLATNTVYASRVFDARGLGGPSFTPAKQSDRVMTFPEFMSRMDSTFPLRNMKRVAVIGAGDSGKCTVEALLGIGPSSHSSVAALDWVDQVDWFAPGLSYDCFTWREEQRSRYQALGAFLRVPENGAARLRVLRETASPLPAGGFVSVNGRNYDHAIVCTGARGRELPGLFEDEPAFPALGLENPTLALQINDRGLYKIGVAANLGFDAADSNIVRRIQANRVAMFRLAGRTAALAYQLGKTNAESLYY